MYTMLKIRKKVTKMGKIRRIIEIPKDYYDVIKVGDKVTILINEKED